jgi:hypothetical protein
MLVHAILAGIGTIGCLSIALVFAYFWLQPGKRKHLCWSWSDLPDGQWEVPMSARSVWLLVFLFCVGAAACLAVLFGASVMYDAIGKLFGAMITAVVISSFIDGFPRRKKRRRRT